MLTILALKFGSGSVPRISLQTPEPLNTHNYLKVAMALIWSTL